MSTTEQAEQNTESQPGIKLNITLHGKLLLPLEIAGTDTLLEIKQFLSDSSVLYFFTNYHFALNDKSLNEYVDIASLGLATDSTLDIKLDPFDQRSAKQHVKKVQEVLETPAILASIFEKFQDGEAAEDSKGKKGKTAQKRESSDDDEQDELSSDNHKKNSGEQQQTNGKNNHTNTSNLPNSKQNASANGDSNSSSSREVCQLEDAILASLGNRLIQTELNAEQSSSTECVCYLNYSGYNPPPQYRAIQGDLFYLSLKTLENISYQITACPKGFYVNKSTAKQFDPSYYANKPAVFVNLISLLKSISPLFKEKYEEISNSNGKGTSMGTNPSDSLNLPVLSFYKYGHRWLHAKSNPAEHEWNMNRCESSLLNLYGFDVNGPRDWNEELQICRDLPHGEFIERLNRDKANIKVQSEFVEAATEGAKAVIDHNIASLNPMDPVHQQVYVYNQIFFSYALENIDHFKQETGPDASPNVTTANCDLRNLRVLHKLDIPGLSVLNTCLVDYKGQRVIAQSIIPGILNSDHSNCSQYGSIDDGKTIHNNEEFAEMMKAICEYFQLDDAVQFTDEQSAVHTLCGSIEVKGIRGSDRRKYILDLMRLSPRDLNYPGVNENLCCTLRHELIANFALAKNFQAATKNIKEQEDKEGKDEKESKENGGNTQEDKNKQGLAKFIKIQEYLQDPEHQIKLKLNPNISTKAPLVELPKLKGMDNEKSVLYQHMQLTEISDYLLTKAIPNVINDLITNSENGRISDSSSIEEYFHAHGVNMRYLGRVAGLINKKETPHIYMIVERVILVKAMKHVFREIMRDTEQSYIQQAIAHGLNAVFGSEEIRRKMENGEIGQELRKEQQNGMGNGNVTNESKKKRNKGKKGKKIEMEKDVVEEKNIQEQDCSEHQLSEVISIAEPATISTKPSAIWARIVYVANKRYSHVFPENIEKYSPLSLKFNRLATLRDLLLSIGVHIEAKEYDFSQETGEKKGVNGEISGNNNNIKDANNKDLKNGNNNSNGVSETPGCSTTSSAVTAVLPFQAADIKDITPIVKFIEIVSDDARANIEMGQKYLMDGKVAESLECYQTSANILVNLYGPVHKEHGYCCHKISNVHFKLGEYETAIYYQKQAIAIYKKLYGLDHHATAQAIATLAYYYFTVKKPQRAYKHMLKALFVYSLIGGEPHPDCFHMFMNLSLMFQENEQHQASLSCLFEALDRSITVYGKDHMKIAGCYQAVALAHYDIDDIKKALEYQQNCVRILKLNLEGDDPRVKEALLFQSKFEKTLADKKKGQQVIKSIPDVSESGRSFGTNKVGKSKIEEHQQQGQGQVPVITEHQTVQNPNNDLENEREILKLKMKYAKMNAKYGTRRTYGYDYQRTTPNQEQQDGSDNGAQNLSDEKNVKKQEKSAK